MKKILLLFLAGLYLSHSFAQTKEEDKAIIKSIYFGGGSYYIDEEQIREIRELVKSIPNIEKYQISITSHTDNIGGKEYNDWLSERRSDAVIEQLMDNQIPPEKIYKKDFGQENPLYSNASHEGRMMNRRVDIIFSPLTL